MKLEITVKQKEERVVKVSKVKSYYFDKAYLVITTEDMKKLWFKTSTVLAVQEF